MMNLNIRVTRVAHTMHTLRHWERKIPVALTTVVAKEALHLKTLIQTGIRSQAPGGQKFVPLKPATIRKKGSSKALIDKGDLIRSIKSTKVDNEGHIRFVGVHRKERGGRGQILWNVAEIHEKGAPRAGIPPRPFLAPSYKQWRRGAQQRFIKGIAESIKYKTGEQFAAGGEVEITGEVS